VEFYSVRSGSSRHDAHRVSKGVCCAAARLQTRCKSHDILIDGKNRRGNGKGVRALMNAAFKIGVLVYCRAKNLPHPGVVALDSPLLSYRDPHTSKHGELSPDDQAVTRTGLNEYFYRYLLAQHDAQFIIIENDVPPFDLGPNAIVTTFIGPLGEGGRQGLL
jgi:hypothetical protein